MDGVPSRSSRAAGTTSVVLLLALFAACAPCHCEAKRPKVIIMCVADDLGWNDVDFHGSGQIPTPHLTSLARDGVILDNYYVQPVCSPTRSTILTGRHVIHSGIYDPDCGPGTTLAVPYNFSMLPVHLSKLGYESHAVGKWHLGMFSRRVVPTGKGFSTFLGYYSGAEDYFTHRAKGANDMHNDTGSELRPLTANKGEYSTHIYTRRAIEIIDDFAARAGPGASPSTIGGSGNQGLFMYLAYQAIHAPDEVPDRYKIPFEKTIPDVKGDGGVHAQRRIVAGMVACLDEGIGNVTAALREAGLMEDTLFIFTTDNGGPAQGFNQNMASNWPLRGMKRTLWDGGIRAVGFAHGAGVQSPGRIEKGLMHAADWFPTVISAAAGAGRMWESVVDFESRGEPPFQLGDGVDVWPMISTGAASPRSEVLIEAHPNDIADDGNGQAIIVGGLKLILEKGPMWHGPPNDLWYESGSNPELYNHTVECGPAPAQGPEPPCLFNLTADPCEYHDLKDELPHEYDRLLRRLAAYQATAVPKSFHDLPLCKHPSSPVDKPVDGTWMPVC